MRFVSTQLVVTLLAASAGIPSIGRAQLSPVPLKSPPPWADTTGESPIYPVGDAIPVYRAVLDLLYLDGDKRPPIIVLHDTAQRGLGGPCPFAKCIGPAWKHRAKIDTATLLGFARMSPKRPRIREFGYPIPIAFLSFDDVRRMRADGAERIADRPPPQYPSMMAGFWAEFTRKYPGAWGVTHISKVGFNPRHTQAMVSVRQWCGENCVSDEILFLRKTSGRWRIAERVPSEIDVSRSSSGSLRYVGPMVRDAKESEIITADRPGTPTEASARANVYRLVLDSLYSFHGEHPKSLVLTDGAFGGWFDTIPTHQSVIDSAVAERFRLVHTIRLPLDTRPKFHIPIATFPADSLPGLKEKGVALDAVAGTGSPLWLGFTRRFPRAWGMVSLSRIAFNANRSQALVTTTHVCGEQCYNTDIWFLTRSGRKWQIAERIPTPGANGLEIEPLRYIGLDADPNAYRPRRVQGVVTDENGKPLPNLVIKVRRLLMNSGVNVDDPPIRTDSAGHYTLTNLPRNGAMTMLVPCPGPQKREGQPSAAQVQPIGVTAGMDTTINMTVDFSVCDPAAEEARDKPAAPTSH